LVQTIALNSAEALRASAGRGDQNALWEEILQLDPSPVAVMVSLLPHGGAKMVRATPSALAILRSADQSAALLNGATWRAVDLGRTIHFPVQNAQHSVDHQLANAMSSADVRESIVAPLSSYAFRGYPAAIHLFTVGDKPVFTDALRARLQANVDRFNANAASDSPRVFVLSAQSAPVLNATAWSSLPQPLAAEMLAKAAEVMAKVTDEMPLVTHRVSHLDQTGKRTSVRYAAYRSHPATGGEPGIVIAIQPSIAEWMQIRADDVFADPEFARFLPALRFIHDQASKNPSLSSIARSVHLSPFHFHRKFAEVVGMTPKQFLLECQIAEAQHLLLTSNIELSKVALACGFAHQSHFTSRFKQATGVTPSQWRRLNRPS